jgi:hypothetical protein
LGFHAAMEIKQVEFFNLFGEQVDKFNLFLGDFIMLAR